MTKVHAGAALAMVLAAGCTGDPPDYNGFNMDTFFPFDGNRTWTFVSADETVPYEVVGTLSPDAEPKHDNASRAHTVTFTTECVATSTDCEDGPFRMRSWTISSDRTHGTLIWAADFESTGPLTFDPPIMLTDGQGKPGDIWESDAGGEHWVAIFDHKGDCPVLYTDQWDNCVEILLDDDGDAATPGTHPLHGSYYAVPSYNVVAFTQSEDPTPGEGEPPAWRLLSAFWEATD